MLKQSLRSIIFLGLCCNQINASQNMTFKEKSESTAFTALSTFGFTGAITSIPAALLLKDNALSNQDKVSVLTGFVFATGVGVSVSLFSSLLGNFMKYLKFTKVGEFLAGYKEHNKNTMLGNSYIIGTVAGVCVFAKTQL